MKSCLHIAEVLLAEAETQSAKPVSLGTLERLLYLAQGFHLALFGAPLFDEPIRAGEQGVILDCVRERFADCDADCLDPAGSTDFDPLNPLLVEFLREVCDEFARYVPWKHPEVTEAQFETSLHGLPLKKALEEGGVVSIEQMRSYFAARVDLG